ncbi:hypothetical protein [Hymenobacter sp. YC55]|uniref:hypothetical protein n=1 Tax=Hymenobacter sp. YC55 TaxID=3034019 RepID=UPI0023F8AED9|nr:hypothetical protein [Hymenobacter sp. YC55]MDF7815371.1 hypothetical protein [Hymenobacter sp. YC55]
MDLNDWTLASDQPPPCWEGYENSEPVLVIIGVTSREVGIAVYNHVTGNWSGNDYFGDYGQHVERLVTHWKFVGPLPPPLPAAFVKALEPDFISENTPMRALFAGVDAADKPLHKILYAAVRDNGLQGVQIRANGSKQKTFYYVDFLASDPLELRDIKQKLNQLDVPFTITAKQ